MKIIKCKDSTQFKRVSRWITIKELFSIRKDNMLYSFTTDKFLKYFIHKGKKYALDQFIRLDSTWLGSKQHVFIENNEECYISAVDYTNYYNPYYLELSKDGEKVRLYEIITG